MKPQITNQNSILLNDEALDIIVDILLSISHEGVDYIEPATDNSEVA